MLAGASGPLGESLRAWAVVVLIVLVAGCLSPSAPTATAPAPDAPSVAGSTALTNASVVPAPLWRTGDAWEVTTKGGGAQHATLVVTSASSDAYTLGTSDAQLASFDAIFDISYLGKIRAEDLAGAQKGAPVAFFAFPMRDGLTWSATWDGLPVTMTASYDASKPGFAIVATANGKPYATYDYVPALKWWSHLDFAEGYGLKVDRLVENWTGSVATATAKQVFNSTTIFPVATLNTQTFHVDERQTFLLVALQGGAKAYARSYQLVDPNGTAYPSGAPQTDAQPSGGFTFSQAQLPAVPGDWKISAPAAHSNDGYFALDVHEVAIQLRPFPG